MKILSQHSNRLVTITACIAIVVFSGCGNESSKPDNPPKQLPTKKLPTKKLPTKKLPTKKQQTKKQQTTKQQTKKQQTTKQQTKKHKNAPSKAKAKLNITPYRIVQKPDYLRKHLKNTELRIQHLQQNKKNYNQLAIDSFNIQKEIANNSTEITYTSSQHFKKSHKETRRRGFATPYKLRSDNALKVNLNLNLHLEKGTIIKITYSKQLTQLNCYKNRKRLTSYTTIKFINNDHTYFSNRIKYISNNHIIRNRGLFLFTKDFDNPTNSNLLNFKNDANSIDYLNLKDQEIAFANIPCKKSKKYSFKIKTYTLNDDQIEIIELLRTKLSFIHKQFSTNDKLLDLKTLTKRLKEKDFPSLEQKYEKMVLRFLKENFEIYNLTRRAKRLKKLILNRDS